MTYAAQELSLDAGRPVELYTFSIGSEFWRYTSADADVTIMGNVYTAVPISRSQVNQEQAPGKNPITITAGRDLPFSLQFVSAPPVGTTRLTIDRYHVTDQDTQLVRIWDGTISNVMFEKNQVRIRSTGLLDLFERPLLRRLYSVSCPHVLYGPHCRADGDSIARSGTVDAVSSTTITAQFFSNRPDNWYRGGYLEFGLQQRFILSHVLNVITINLPFSSLNPGNTITAYAGCDHLLSTCVMKFSNEENYGGFPFSPDKNPFGSNSVF